MKLSSVQSNKLGSDMVYYVFQCTANSISNMIAFQLRMSYMVGQLGLCSIFELQQLFLKISVLRHLGMCTTTVCLWVYYYSVCVLMSMACRIISLINALKLTHHSKQLSKPSLFGYLPPFLSDQDLKQLPPS